MENYFDLILYPHIVSGFLALLVAPIAMVVKKGGPAHRFWGKIFFYSMCIVAISSVIMAFIKSNMFLGMVAVLSFYLVSSGYRALYRRHVKSIKQVESIDWILLAFSGMFCLALTVLGRLIIWSNHKEPFGYIAFLFGFIGTRSVVNDIISFTKKDHHKENWMYNHMSGKIGGYIATVSAFSAVNMSFLPQIVQWLWPTFVGVPFLLFWISRYKRKKTKAVSHV